MDISEAKLLIERHDENATRIEVLRYAIRALAHDNPNASAARCDIHVRQGTVDRIAVLAVSKDIARPLYEAELAKVERHQADIERRLAAA